MLLSNCRIDTKSGMEFYEQDILLDDYVYYGNMQITMNISYMAPGFGIVIFNGDGTKMRNKTEMYMVRVGYNEASVVYKHDDMQEKVLQSSVNLYPTGEDMTLIFTKTGKKLSLSLSDGTTIINEYYMASTFDSYNIGYYSNAGNIIKDVSIASSVPEGWTINMNNTNGGHIQFSKNSFKIEDCKDLAEIEQSNISLTPGTYYLQYESTDINNLNDITPYVLAYNDDNYYDDKKSILKGNKFTLKEDTIVNIKFKGTSGMLSKIHLSDNATDKYIATEGTNIIIDGSYIKVDLTNIVEIDLTGTILDVPIIPPDMDPADSDYNYFILADGTNTYKPEDLGVIMNKEYSYKFTKGKIEVLGGSSKAVADVDSITLFTNMNAIISKMTLIEESGQVINLIAEETTKKMIPAPISSPIVVIDNNNIPLDLSSSYRIYDSNGYDKYLFTNIEREIFNSSTCIKLAGALANKPGALKMYGIYKDSTVNMDNIYRIPSVDTDTIAPFCEKYDVILNSYLYTIDYDSNTLYFYDEDVSKYDYIIVDYLKDNSYCINYMKDIDQYEVDISASKAINLVYDGIRDSSFSTVQNYKVTDIIPQQNCYIVLKRGE